MPSHSPPEVLGGAQLRTWRTATAVRVFAMALALGTLLSDRSYLTASAMLVVIGLIAVVSSLLEWWTRNRPTHWFAVGETAVVAALVVATNSVPPLGAYLAVPAIVAGVRHGLVTTVNVTLVALLSGAATLALDPGDDPLMTGASSSLWILVGLGVGLLTSWQSRTTRDLAARQAPYTAAHQLMARLHRLASTGTVGLDSATLATELDVAMRVATGASRTSIFVVEPDGNLRPVLIGGDLELLRAEIALPDAERTPGAAVVPLTGASQVLGHCVLVGIQRWTPEIEQAARDVADEFAVRLDTAVLFDEIRHLAAAEERNRIAREMHDGVAQEIVALGYVVDEIESTSAEPSTIGLAASLREEISRVVTELRYSIFDLRHEVQSTDLAEALTDYVRAISRDTELRVHLVLDHHAPRLPSFTQAELMRIAQQAVGNVRKHAAATNLWVTLVSDERMIRLEVSDDGVGKAVPRERHWGIQGMQERARGIGADIAIGERAGGGTSVRVLVAQSVSTQGSAAV